MLLIKIMDEKMNNEKPFQVNLLNTSKIQINASKIDLAIFDFGGVQ